MLGRDLFAGISRAACNDTPKVPYFTEDPRKIAKYYHLRIYNGCRYYLSPAEGCFMIVQFKPQSHVLNVVSNFAGTCQELAKTG